MNLEAVDVLVFWSLEIVVRIFRQFCTEVYQGTFSSHFPAA